MRGKQVVSLSCFFFFPAPSNRAWSYPGRGCHGPGGDPFAKRERSSLRFDGAERRSTTLSRTHWSVGLWWGTGRRSRSMPPWLGIPATGHHRSTPVKGRPNDTLCVTKSHHKRTR